MTNQLLKTIAVGILLGAGLYFIPFFLIGKLIFFLFIMFIIFRVFRGRRSHYRGSFGWSYADHIRSMSDDEYQAFKDRYRSDCGEDTHQENKGKEDKS